jgi:hypothetical protein
MNDNTIESVLENPSEERIRALLHDPSRVFWVNWREEDDAIINDCEAVLQTGDLAGEFVSDNAAGGYRVFIRRAGRRLEVPLTYSLRDRHITLLALNKALAPQYEIRLCLASALGDTLAFMPMTTERWRDLEARFPETLSELFYVLTEHPNVFTDPFPPPVTWQELAQEPSNRREAIRLYQKQHGVGMGEAKQAIDAWLGAAAK